MAVYHLGALVTMQMIDEFSDSDWLVYCTLTWKELLGMYMCVFECVLHMWCCNMKMQTLVTFTLLHVLWVGVYFSWWVQLWIKNLYSDVCVYLPLTNNKKKSSNTNGAASRPQAPHHSGSWRWRGGGWRDFKCLEYIPNFLCPPVLFLLASNTQ